MLRCLTMAALLFRTSADSTNPNLAGGTSGCNGGFVTPCNKESVQISKIRGMRY